MALECRLVSYAPDRLQPITFDPVHHEYRILGERDVWIGANTVICGGVTIGQGSVIGAGSVVNKDIPPMVVAAGTPCRVVREICRRLYNIITYQSKEGIRDERTGKAATFPQRTFQH